MRETIETIGRYAVQVQENRVGGQNGVAFRGTAAGKPAETDEEKQAAQEYVAVDRDQSAKRRSIQ